MALVLRRQGVCHLSWEHLRRAAAGDRTLWPRGDLKLHRTTPSHGDWSVYLKQGQDLTEEWEKHSFCAAGVLCREHKVGA